MRACRARATGELEPDKRAATCRAWLDGSLERSDSPSVMSSARSPVAPRSGGSMSCLPLS